MSKKILFDEDSDEDINLKTENEYAKKYDSWREKEEIHKLEQKYGPDALKNDGSVSSDSEDDSDGPPEVSEEVEEQFLKTLALLKTKDPRIYDPSFKCFAQEEEKKQEEKSKPKTLTFDDSDDDDDDGDIFKIEKKAEIDDESTKKEKPSQAPKKKKEKKIKEYLTGEAEHIDEEVEKDLAPLKALWSDPKLNEGEAFLRDYILNKRYLEDGEAGEGAERLRDDVELEADEQTVEEQSKFERAYNFRFEEPDDEYLKRFPRTLSSIRPKDERRSRKRAEVRARKEDDKRRKMDDIARLKALKLKEIHEKIAKIKQVTGNDQLAFQEEDIEGDFDPEEHDRRMQALFDEQYYGGADHTKPVFPDLDEELEIENWDNYDVDAAPEPQEPDDDEQPHCEDEEFNMDADYDPTKPRAGLLEEIQKTLGKRRRQRKRKPQLAALLAARKPRHVPAAGSYAAYMDEYYRLDCEDVLGGDLPTRFKYREVVPNDYGLTVEEILLADDKELTQWVPLKKIVRHRPAPAERADVGLYAARARDDRLKRAVLPSLFRDLPQEPELVVPVEEGEKKKKKKKKKNKEKPAEDADATETNENNDREAIEQNNDEVPSEVKPKKKKNKYKEAGSQKEQKNDNESQSDEKLKKKKKNKNNSQVDEEFGNIGNDGISQDRNSVSVVGRKKKNKNQQSDKEKSQMTEEVCNVNVTVNEMTTEEIKSNKKKKRSQIETNGDENIKISANDNVQNSLLETKNKHISNAFVVEDVSTQRPSQKCNVNNITSNSNQGKGKKRKLETNKDPVQNKKKKHDIPNNKSKKASKKKFNKNDKFKNKKQLNNKKGDASTDNPLSKLSDERLKAYGLNPKKYKNFLKYKKF